MLKFNKYICPIGLVLGFLLIVVGCAQLGGVAMRDYIMKFTVCRGQRDKQGFRCSFSDNHVPLYMIPSATAKIMLKR